MAKDGIFCYKAYKEAIFPDATDSVRKYQVSLKLNVLQ